MGDKCLFRSTQLPRDYLAVHVDDILEVSESSERIEEILRGQPKLY